MSRPFLLSITLIALLLLPSLSSATGAAEPSALPEPTVSGVPAASATPRPALAGFIAVLGSFVERAMAAVSQSPAAPSPALAEVTPAPTLLPEPDASVVPQALATPTPEPEPTPTAELTSTPEPTPTAEPTPTPKATAAPEASARPGTLPEPDFIVGDWELQDVPWEELRLNDGPLLPIKTVGPQDSNSVPMRPLGPDGRLVYNPTVLAQQGMKRLDTYVRTGNALHLRQARKYANVLDAIAAGNRTRRWQPHGYDLGPQEAGWVNGNSHGLVLSFLSRFHALTGSPQRSADAELLLAAFEQREENRKWITTVTGGGYVWFEHWPDGKFEHTLNAHLNAMFGLYDYWQATGSPLAEQYFLGGAATVREKLYRFRRKDELSRYSLSGTFGTLHYHETHIDQLRLLAKMTGDDWFARQADVLVKDEAAWRLVNRGLGRRSAEEEAAR